MTQYIAMDVAATEGINLIADACALPLRAESIDLVVSFDVIQHISSTDKVLEEMSRVLRPGGYALLTFPFFYAECDFHDYHRWTLEGMIAALEARRFEVVLARRRGGACFAAACALIWALQHAIPGQRRSWRGDRSWLGVVRAAGLAIMTAPAILLGWLALFVDSFLKSEGCYMGGAVLAKRAQNPGGPPDPTSMFRGIGGA